MSSPSTISRVRTAAGRAPRQADIFANADVDGAITVQSRIRNRNSIDANGRFISVSHPVNGNITINPARSMSEMAHWRWRALSFVVWLKLALVLLSTALLAEETGPGYGDPGASKTTTGVCATFEVDESVLKREFLNHFLERTRVTLRRHRIWYGNMGVDDDTFSFEVRSEEDVDDALPLIDEMILPVPGGRGDDSIVMQKSSRIFVRPTPPAVDDLVEAAMASAAEMLERRIVETRRSEYRLVRQDRTRLSVRIPGITSLKQLWRTIPSGVKFHVMLQAGSVSANDQTVEEAPPGQDILRDWKNPDNRFLVFKRFFVSGSDLVSAKAMRTPNGAPAIRVQLQSVGAHRLGELTAGNIGGHLVFVLNGRVFSTSVIRSEIADGVFHIVPDATPDQVNELAAMLRLSISHAPITLIEEKTCSWRSGD